MVKISDYRVSSFLKTVPGCRVSRHVVITMHCLPCVFSVRPEQPEHVVNESVEVEPACKRVKPNSGKVSFKMNMYECRAGFVFLSDTFVFVLVDDEDRRTRRRYNIGDSR